MSDVSEVRKTPDAASMEAIVHTPWIVVENGNNHWGKREVIGPAMRVVGFTIATDVDQKRAKQVESDAKLIAAAPELLKALLTIASIDYTKAATNGAAYDAVQIASKAASMVV
jgi:hypothetical protein